MRAQGTKLPCPNSFFIETLFGLPFCGISLTLSKEAAVVVGTGLISLPSLIPASEDPVSVDLPTVSLIDVANYGSAGFEMEFRVSSSFPHWIAEGCRSTLCEQYWTTTRQPRLRWRRV